MFSTSLSESLFLFFSKILDYILLVWQFVWWESKHYSVQSQKRFRFLKLSNYQFKQLKSYVRIWRNFKAKMAFNNKEWHVKIYIRQSAMNKSIIHSQHSLPFSSSKMLCTRNLNLTIRFRYNLWFKEWLLDFELSKAQAGKVKKMNN